MRRDPRIPQDAQIRDECYGNAPKFGLGDMTCSVPNETNAPARPK